MTRQHKAKSAATDAVSGHVFGYGSLVNRATHDHRGAVTAQLGGWRRRWVQTGLRPVAYLSVVRDAGCRIDGLIAPVAATAWPALDLREAAYARHLAGAASPDIAGVQIYAVPDASQAAPTDPHPILQSYLDVVFQGYLREFGPEGVQRFIATTDGWEAPILDDRATPRYPRSQPLGKAERALFDDLLVHLGSRRMTA